MDTASTTIDLEGGLAQSVVQLETKATTTASSTTPATFVPVSSPSLPRRVRRCCVKWRTRAAAAVREHFAYFFVLLLVSLGILLAVAEVYVRVSSVSERMVRRGAESGHGPSAVVLFLLEA